MDDGNHSSRRDTVCNELNEEPMSGLLECLRSIIRTDEGWVVAVLDDKFVTAVGFMTRRRKPRNYGANAEESPSQTDAEIAMKRHNLRIPRLLGRQCLTSLLWNSGLIL